MRSIFSASIFIILLLVFLSFAYDQVDDRYVDLGEGAPLPSQLHPKVQEKKDILLEQAADINIDVEITSTTRSMKEQDELYAKGRTSEGNIVTNAKGGESYHNYGLAFDYALRLENSDVIWDTTYDGNNNGKPDWVEVAELAKELGFEWGGDWENFPDYPHLQMSFDLRISQLQKGLRPVYEEDSEEDKE